jgi:1,4-dihydroxy-2-naphthoyl-CoA hydrolase
MVVEPQAAGSDGFGELIGIEYLEHGPELVRARAEVSDRIRQPYGIVHGGAYSAIAESICSAATALAVMPDGKLAMGQSNSATFLRPITAGHVNATAHRRHGGRTTWVWDTEITDDADRLCAMVRVTIAVREAPPTATRGTGS